MNVNGPPFFAPLSGTIYKQPPAEYFRPRAFHHRRKGANTSADNGQLQVFFIDILFPIFFFNFLILFYHDFFFAAAIAGYNI